MKAIPVIQTAVPTGGPSSSAGIATGAGNAEAAAGSPSVFAGALKAAGTKPGRRSGVAKQPDDGAAGGNLPPTGNPPPPIAAAPAPAAGGVGALHRPVDSGLPEAIGVGRSGAQSAASAEKPSTAPRGVGATGAPAGFTGATGTTATIVTTASKAALDGSAAIDGNPAADAAAGTAADAAGNAETAGAAGEPLSTFAWAASSVSAETLSAAAVSDGSMPLGRAAVPAATRGMTSTKETLARGSTPAQGSAGNSTISAPSASSGAIASDDGGSGLSAPIAAAVPDDLPAGDATRQRRAARMQSIARCPKGRCMVPLEPEGRRRTTRSRTRR
jgi:hypothetical protein